MVRLHALRIRRGFTLLEVLVACVLSLIVLGLVFSFILPTMRTAARGASQADMQQQVAVTLSKLAEDLQETSPQGVSLLTSDTQGLPPPSPAPAPPIAVGVDRVFNVTQTGGQRWALGTLTATVTSSPDPGLIVYYWDSVGGSVTRCVWMASSQPPLTGLSGTVPNRLNDTQLLGIASSSALYERQTLATGVQSFTVTSPGQGDLVAEPITLSLRLQRQAATGARLPESFQSTRTVSMRIGG